MIPVKRLNGKEYFVNPDMIKFLEATPDTVITLLSDEKIMVADPIAEVIRRIVDFKRYVHGFPDALSSKEVKN